MSENNTEALRCADEIGGLPVSDFCEALGDDAAAHIRRLVAENEALRADAERYRHIKSIASDGLLEPFVVLNQLDYISTAAEFDAAIDAARSKT